MQPNPLFIACDFSSRAELDQFLKEMEGRHLHLKVGMELFYKEGPEIVHALKEKGHSVFLDLKLHDIPETVKRSMIQLAALGADLVNVHASGGIRMMEAAMEGLHQGTPKGQAIPSCIAVTQLTSTSALMMNEELKIAGFLEDQVRHLAGLAMQAGLKGVVCSSMETEMLKAAYPSIWTLTPGIRLKGSDAGDQVRVCTPGEARQAKTDAIVVGRGITRAEDRLQAYEHYIKEWVGYDNQ
ncbi:orotidine-5'-phosphate decarboxylase [Salisediminibacterium selenitireducens]|uniref:Orotidine 5'-phosphate decarboxylase n=1 Tax=Bacillus selenitireducens (strain ATCC 700615 / DSM 15326 / MLS10) TaxID=439292 RepID=D6XTQ1_BACIE|nr:orotidine-5'-phosphate decarboxylase [Salisediminibacterium selenitireducens]ADH99187.1 orotidine 5'-phosphate decarboxylase [[Bacillus] selenitireducens MLS10]